MIEKVDAALAEIARSAFQYMREEEEEGVSVKFEAPTRDWEAGVTPAVNIFLYDMREDRARRATNTITVYQRDDGELTLDDLGPAAKYALYDPPRWLTLSYMLTTWPSEPAEMHEMLGRLAVAFSQERTVAIELGPQLELLGCIATLDLAQPPPDNRAMTELWPAIENTHRPFLNLNVTLPLPGAEELISSDRVQEDGVEINVGQQTTDRRGHFQPETPR